MFDPNSPNRSHAALPDIDAIRANLLDLRSQGGSPAASPPSNPVSGQLWWATDTATLYQRNQSNSGWLFRWSEADPPAKTSDLAAHSGANITSSTSVHGIRQGSGHGFDADTVDGYHAVDFAASAHTTATTGTHGVGAGAIVGTTLTQTVTNKTINSSSFGSGNTVTGNLAVLPGITIGGRDLSADGAKIDLIDSNGAPADNSVTNPKLTLTSGKRIYDNIITSGNSITISGLNGNVSRIYRLIVKHYVGSNYPKHLYLRFNGDTGNNYGNTGLIEGSAGPADRILLTDSGSGSMGWERYHSEALCDVLISASTGGRRVAAVNSAVVETYSGVPYPRLSAMTGFWNNTSSNIISLTVGISNGSFTDLLVELYSLG